MKPTTYDQLKNITLVLLVLLNIGCIWIIFSKPDFRDKHNDRNGMFAGHLLEKKIGLDQQQIEAFKSLKESHQKELRSKMKEMHEMRKGILDNLDNDTFDIDAYSQKTASIQKELDKMAFEHFRELKSICRPDQYESFDKTMKEMFLKNPKKKLDK
ncbi:hypothetical protein N6H18_08340 [Reichenbachiella agarivorans]|uniref:Heavy-metal resistance n=1 Tax=Reichenbachiella agarivorans TaxID=2979464 RepID=A0ABY6CTV5_9BACT|nr:hypothetical protein [Reichenbachiella agarivorans]UXP33952.1 hypothetical protein N6H18_08340 [Reichenbachiella agarivorans]